MKTKRQAPFEQNNRPKSVPDGSAEFAEYVRANQKKLRSELKSWYDFIVCGSGSSGSAVAGRLAENPDVSVLLLEAGGDDDVPTVNDAGQWVTNIGSERYWQFEAEPNPHLNGRAIPMGMGKVLGGGSSINAMIWARGHKSDWDFFASETGDPAWGYESVLYIYRRIEDWRGAPDPRYRGTGGPVFVQPLQDPNPAAQGLFETIGSLGIPIFENQNGRIMEADGGASVADVRIRNGKRQSVFRSYVFPRMDRPNLTVLPHALVTRLTFEDKRATGVQISYEGSVRSIRAGCEVILSLGAIHTPKVLMQSGIGDQVKLLACRSGSAAGPLPIEIREGIIAPAYHRAALAVRPQSAAPYVALGQALLAKGDEGGAHGDTTAVMGGTVRISDGGLCRCAERRMSGG